MTLYVRISVMPRYTRNIIIQLMTFHKVDTVIYQPRGSEIRPEEVMFTEANG